MKNRYIPFGYQIQNGDSVINTEQAATVQHIFYAYTEGQSFKEIAEYLTTSGTAYHFSDNSWNKNIVARMDAAMAATIALKEQTKNRMNFETGYLFCHVETKSFKLSPAFHRDNL